jgi:multiple sugar transport system permease protein
VSTKTDTIAARAAGRAPARRRRARRRYLTVAAFLSPWIVGFLLLYVYPMFKTLYYSFTKYDGGKAAPRWVGLFNYRFMFAHDPNFWLSLRNTIWIVAVSVPLAIALGVGSAYVLTKPRRGRAFYRTAFFLPTMVPAVAAAVAFLFLLNAGGPIDHILGFFHLPQPLWFLNAQWSKPGLVVIGLWGVGSTMIIFLAALIGVIYGFQYFTEAYVVGASVGGAAGGTSSALGSPQGSTLFYTIWLYQQGFEGFHLGYASAMAWMLFVIVLACTLILIKSSNRWVFYQGGFR